MFSSTFKRHAAQFAISAALATVTPAAAAGLVEGVRVAATTIDQAADVPTAGPEERTAAMTPAAPPNDQIATHAPALLSALAGPGKAAAKTARAPRTHQPAQ
ncbi:MAG: hypothetical protein ABSC92_12085 [Rhizomicrobium sp.]|jgi:hypothetical protein